MSVRDEIAAANEGYAAGFTNSDLAMPPARRFAVVTCMDACLDPARFLELEDALRSLVISHWLLGTQAALIVARNADLHKRAAAAAARRRGG